ncbi:MAG: FAD-binding protein, partial [Clostridia bacterium]|nr:FAD-binding protein [Clostridia bacterium]
FLISEAVRGEGGILRNKDGDAYMADKHPMKDLAPRDIVTRVTAEEMVKTDSSHVYLDITSKTDTVLLKRFPTIFKKCQENNIDISKDWIPVCPVQHYLMGGLKTDINGMTNIKGLYASGEAACTGVHGANRLASNSLLECLVFGRRCAQHINEYHQNSFSDYVLEKNELPRVESKELDYDKLSKEIKEIMTSKGGIIREEADMKEALGQMNKILESLDAVKLMSKQSFEVYNMATVSKEILTAAIKRKNNVGAHYRTDI